MTPTIITIGNSKGGVAKTTTAINLSTELGKLNIKVLLLDFDQEGSLGKGALGGSEMSKGIEDLLVNPCLNPAEYIRQTKIKNVSIIPCGKVLGDVALKLVNNASFFALKEVVKRIEDFEYIIIDTHPSKDILLQNALACSEFVIIPTNPGTYPLMDLVDFEETIRNAIKNFNPVLSILGIVVTMVSRGTVYKQLEADLRNYFGEKVFKTTISRMAKSEESAIEGVGVSQFDPDCKLSKQYRALTIEIFKRMTNVSTDTNALEDLRG